LKTLHMSMLLGTDILSLRNLVTAKLQESMSEHALARAQKKSQEEEEAYLQQKKLEAGVNPSDLGEELKENGDLTESETDFAEWLQSRLPDFEEDLFVREGS